MMMARAKTLVTKTQGQSCLQMQQRLSSSTNRSRAVQVKQTSRCPQGPYATHSNGSAHTAQHSSMPSCCRGNFPPQFLQGKKGSRISIGQREKSMYPWSEQPKKP
jgi:hypothetical protein